MKIGLFGFTTDHENMGCQALTCSFIAILNELIDNNLELIVFGGGNGLGVIPDLFPNIKFEYCEALLKKPIFIKKLLECEIVFDETFGDGFSDIYFGKDEYKDIAKKIIAEVFSKKFVLTPQTYGPFKDKKMEKIAGRVIRKANIVFSRDTISANYAKKISGRDVVTVTDLAFCLPYTVDLKNSNTIGFNVSGLLWQGGFAKNSNQFGLSIDYQSYCRQIISMLSDMGYCVHLIPHVTRTINPTRTIPDGDYPACIALHKEFPNTVLAPCFETPVEEKNYIATMEIFIGARMHSTIGAFSSDVVTIPVAYSRKFQGLFESLKYKYFVDGKNLSTEEAVHKTIEYVLRKKELKSVQNESMKIVNEQLTIFKENLRELL